MPPDARGWQLWVVPLPGGQPYRRLQWMTDVVPRVTNLAWMPDSRHVVLGLTSIGTSESHLWMADLQRDRAWWLTRGPGSESYPSSSPDGTQVAFSAGESDYDVVEVSSNGVRRLVWSGQKRVRSGVVARIKRFWHTSPIAVVKMRSG